MASADAGFDREEGLLKDVLDELDRERSRRAELEDQVRKLQDEAASALKQRTALDTEQSNMSQRVFVSMEAQVKGFQQIVDALTLGKPAIAAAAANERSEKLLNTNALLRSRMGQSSQADLNKTMPLYVVRLLEVLPWDPRVKQHIFAVEEIFEWQVFRDKEWQHQLRFFPTVFKTLPTVKAESSTTSTLEDDILSYNFLSESSASKDNRSFLSFLAGSEMKSKQRLNRIFTNERLTAMYDLDHGYPLPKKDGCTWEWVGGWRIGARGSVGANDTDHHTRVDSGKDGWSYAVQPRDFLLGLSDNIWDNAGDSDVTSAGPQSGKGTVSAAPSRTFRRRRWMRQRVLVDYLHASTATQEFLKIMAENAQLSVGAGKICDQLVETKVALTEAEEKLSMLTEIMQRKDALLKAAGIVDETLDVPKEARAVNSRNGNGPHGSDLELYESGSHGDTKSELSLPLERNNSSHDSSDKFDWKKIGRGAIINKLKPPGL